MSEKLMVEHASPTNSESSVLTLAVIGLFPAASEGAIRLYQLDHDTSTAGNVKFFDKGGLQLRADCQFDTTEGPELYVTAATTKDHATIHANQQRPGDDAFYQEDDDWNTGRNPSVSRESQPALASSARSSTSPGRRS